MTLQKQLEYIHREFLVDTQWVEDPKASIAEVDYDSDSRKEMKRERIKKTSTALFAIITVTALFAVSLIMASQHASAHHKAHTASTQSTTVAVHKAHTAPKGVHQVAITVHHKAHTAPKGVHQVAVDPQAHGIPLLNATALKKEIAKEVKGPYGETDVIGGMMSGGY